MVLRFLKFDEFLYTIDKLYISKFFVIYRWTPKLEGPTNPVRNDATQSGRTNSGASL